MASPLSESQISEVEQFISSSRDMVLPSISNDDISSAVRCYNEIVGEPATTYRIFGSNGMGYLCYAYYKARNEKIYIISVNIQQLSHYAIVDDEWKKTIGIV
jgi:hypothetical protein